MGIVIDQLDVEDPDDPASSTGGPVAAAIESAAVPERTDVGAPVSRLSAARSTRQWAD